MSHYSIRISWSERDSMYVAVCPALGDVSALGHTAPKAAAELQKAIRLALETYAAEGWPVPEPDILEEYSGQFRLRLPRSMHAWLVHEGERQGVSLNALVTSFLARAMGTVEATATLSKEVVTAINSMKADIVSAMQTANPETTANSYTLTEAKAQSAETRALGSSSGTVKWTM